MPNPTPQEIDEAARRLQRGGLLGRGSPRQANKLVKEAGDQGDKVAWQIMCAADNYEPRDD